MDIEITTIFKTSTRFDLCDWSETLMRTPDGSYYLRCSGEINSKYPIIRKGIQDTETIRTPLSVSEAHEWAKKYMTEAEIKDVFYPAEKR